ncbi:hypothetical protein BDU57DRAFT_524522 [Ampelomyces quisqualis]|uniref:CHAT domain-containing protein n=1 Tax=Ampelomyces quisqualis TaxID=50730 RepID=A0A6A5QAV4_AMPQU|nr:hypothetical protein BDU57DRAFT_524522 [Ampelomyces quisqualis]
MSTWYGMLITIVKAVVSFTFVAGIWIKAQVNTWFNSYQPPGTTTIRLSRVENYIEGKRAWEVKITHNNKTTKPLTLFDPFVSHQYTECFKFIADDSHEVPESKDKIRIHKQKIDKAQAQMRSYATELIKRLKLGRLSGEEKQRNIVIVERLEEAREDDKSLHNLVWELLEDVEFWEFEKVEDKVDWNINVTRVIETSRGGLPDTDFRLPADRPLRMLLVTGRSVVKKSLKYREKIDSDLIQRSVMQVMRHLEDIGHYRTVQLDILRPASLAELSEYLMLAPEAPGGSSHYFDIVHLDMHGTMMSDLHDPNGTEKPHLIFTHGKSLRMEPEACVLASQVAEVLGQRTRLLVMNACNDTNSTGGLGLRLVRMFLKGNMEYVSATSYRLISSSALIFYPAFYMSLLLHGSFNKAAGDARLALRKDQKRQKKEQRYDHYVHWNWSRSETVPQWLAPSKSMLLHAKMAIESVPRLLSRCKACVGLNANMPHESMLDRYPRYAVHSSFHDLERHIRGGQRFNVPSMNLPALDIEYWLKTNDHHAVYLHPRSLSHEKPTRLERIQHLVTNMVGLWVETNFVTEVRVLQIEQLRTEWLAYPWRGTSPAWPSASLDVPVRRGEWTLKQRACIGGRKQLRINKLLVIDGVHLLVDEKLREKKDRRTARIVKKLMAHAQDMTAWKVEAGGQGEPSRGMQNEDIYTIIIGKLPYNDWKSVDGFKNTILQDKFAGAETIQLNA